MSFLDLFLPSDKTAGQGQTSFDHPKVFNQLTTGPGPRGLSILSESVGRDIVGRLEAMDANLKRALKTSQGAWTGHAADSASASTTPLSDAVQASRENSAEIGKQVEHQADHFSKVKTMPAPKKVEPLDLGLGHYLPGGGLAEQVDKEIQERQANEVEEAARQQYTTYQESTKSTTGSMPRYSPVPNPLTSVGAAETRPAGTIDPNTGDPGGGGVTGSTGDSGGSGGSGSGSGGSGGSGGGGGSDVLQPDNHGRFPDDHVIMDDWGQPDDTDSQSHTPPPPGQTPPSGPTPSTTGGGGTGGGGGIGMMTGAGAAGGAVSGGASGGRGVSMSGRLGPGGSSGIGGGTGASAGGSAAGSASGARGAGAGAMGGAGGRGRGGGGGAEEEEHERKYVEDSDEPFEFDGELDESGNVVAPPVIGEHRPPSHYR